jgi:beta-glucosidase-like glycosyl hydrolase
MLHRLLGYNHVLGPTVDRSRRYGALDQPSEAIQSKAEACLIELDRFELLVTLKHYPYTPGRFSLHEENQDQPLDAETVKEKVRIFDILLPKTQMVMTTHLYNSAIDPTAPATFSETWLNQLHNKGFKGLILTDALMMMDGYGQLLQQKGWLTIEDAPEITNPSSIFAIKSILAGHHIVILEGHAGDTRTVHRDLTWLLQQKSPLAQRFKAQVQRNLRKIATFKAQHQHILKREPEYQQEILERTITLMNRILHNKGETCTHQAYWQSLKPHIQAMMQ